MCSQYGLRQPFFTLLLSEGQKVCDTLSPSRLGFTEGSELITAPGSYIQGMTSRRKPEVHTSVRAPRCLLTMGSEHLQFYLLWEEK